MFNSQRRILATSSIFLFFLFVYTFVSGDSRANTLIIPSDGSWKSFNQVQPGWELLGYDDSGWRNAFEYYGPYWPNKFWGIAVPVWDWPGTGTPNGTNGPLRAYFRKIIHLTAPVESASVTFSADDAAAIYVNGTLIRHATGGKNIPIPATLFNLGDNILAVYANDGQVDRVYERTREIVGFYFEITTGSCLDITGFSGAETTINPLPLSGQRISLDITTSGGASPDNIRWTLFANDQAVSEGASLADGVKWDGRDGNGMIVPGTYELMISVETKDGCVAERTITAVLEMTDDCKLRATFPDN